MKKQLITILALFPCTWSIGQSIDTMFVHLGGLVHGYAIKDVDSIVFHHSEPISPPKDTTPTHPDLGKIRFITDSTWTVGSQTWSDVVQTTACSKKTDFDGGTTENYFVDCRSNPDYKGDLFSWEMVNYYGAVLCPSPWRVPSKQDFVDLDIALGGTGKSAVSSALLAKYKSLWGGALGGWCNSDGKLLYQDSDVLYWSKSTYSPDYSYALYFSGLNGINPERYWRKGNGVLLRCVR